MSDNDLLLDVAEFGSVPELDLHGLSRMEAESFLDRFLYAEYKNGSRSVRIIHGKGGGALQKAVFDTLGSHPLVESFRLITAGRGGGGATAAVLANNESYDAFAS